MYWYGYRLQNNSTVFIFTFFWLQIHGDAKSLDVSNWTCKRKKSYSFRLLSVCCPRVWNHLIWTAWMRNLDISFGCGIRYSENLNRVYFKWYEYLTSIKLKKYNKGLWELESGQHLNKEIYFSESQLYNESHLNLWFSQKQCFKFSLFCFILFCPWLLLLHPRILYYEA